MTTQNTVRGCPDGSRNSRIRFKAEGIIHGISGFDRGRVFYPRLVAVNATYYILFAVMGSSTSALALESLIAAAFFAVVVAGFKKNLWLAVAGLAGHAVFDFFHHLVIQNPGVPVWWPGFCISLTFSPVGFL